MVKPKRKLNRRPDSPDIKTRFQPGNQASKKLSTPELKAEAYRQYCAHIASGESKRSWYFEHPELMLTWETMEKYIENDPDFDPLHKQMAECKSLKHWEDLGKEMMVGKIKGGEPAIFQMFMRNKFKWDRQDKDAQDPQAASAAKKLDEKLEIVRPTPQESS